MGQQSVTSPELVQHIEIAHGVMDFNVDAIHAGRTHRRVLIGHEQIEQHRARRIGRAGVLVAGSYSPTTVTQSRLERHAQKARGLFEALPAFVDVNNDVERIEGEWSARRRWSRETMVLGSGHAC